MVSLLPITSSNCGPKELAPQFSYNLQARRLVSLIHALSARDISQPVPTAGLGEMTFNSASHTRSAQSEVR